jgi:hypothetical protein
MLVGGDGVLGTFRYVCAGSARSADTATCQPRTTVLNVFYVLVAAWWVKGAVYSKLS